MGQRPAGTDGGATFDIDTRLAYHRQMRRLGQSFVRLVVFAATVWAVEARAAVVEPDGLTVPINQALSSDYFELSNQRFRPDTLGLQSMFDLWEGAGRVNAYADGIGGSVGFVPLCSVSASMILRGGACLVDFGWYCVDDPAGQEVIHPMVTQADVATYHDATLATLPGKPPPPPNSWSGYSNSEKGFVPTIQSGYLVPLTGAGSTQSLVASADFLACKSGKIGFAFQGNPTSICPMSKFTEPKRNQISAFEGKPWINAIVYASKKYRATYYVAFEDMPTSETSLTPTLGSVMAAFPQMTNSSTGWQTWKNDGDFNDLVYRIEGVVCQGGGQPCTPSNAGGSPMQGACALGVTACPSGAQSSGVCLQQRQPTAETCNGWDDDCNGIADDGEGLCAAGYVCDAGKCVGACGTAEFPCAAPSYSCQTTGRLAGYCVETACLNVECPSGQRCRAGTCIGSCENRTCPTGQECLAGSCVDLCAGVSCPTNHVCERGVCVADCRCRPCSDSVKSACDVTGHCVDQPCAGVVCDPYKTCVAGACVNPCASSACVTGSSCLATSDGKANCVAGAGGTGGVMIIGSAGVTTVAATSGGTGGVLLIGATGGTTAGATSGGSSTGLGSGGAVATLGGAIAAVAGSALTSGLGGEVATAGARAIAAAGASAAAVCEPGKQSSCSCTNGKQGAQICAANGSRWESCVCPGNESVDAPKSDGCGCRLSSSRSSPIWLSAALLLLARARRRRGRVARLPQ